ncbi:MAG: hypothetical protein ACREQL_07005, partial [Candidatus Binatia bacterium]
SPPRPRAGEIVRVYGDGFNAIDGNPSGDHCADTLAPCTPEGSCATGPCVNGTCPCSIENAAVRLRNQQTAANRIRLKAKDGTILSTLYPDAVTPTMLAFPMPFDCFAPLTLEVAKRNPTGTRTLATITLCDPTGCTDQPAGAPCDDGSACTAQDRCDGTGQCVGAGPIVCDGPCLTCNPLAGCVPLPASAPCEDADACTIGDHCSGDANTCVPGEPAPCVGACLAGTCDPGHGCDPAPVGTPCRAAAGPCDAAESCDGVSADCPIDGFAPVSAGCDDGDVCTLGDHCTGTGDVCAGAGALACDDACLTGLCDRMAGCQPKDGVKAETCRVDECERPKLHRKLQKLALLVDRWIDIGLEPPVRRITRLRKLLTRCGVTRDDGRRPARAASDPSGAG